MHQALRPYATAGIALVGVGMIAVTPVAAPLQFAVAPDVALTAGFEDIAQDAQTVSTALADAGKALSEAISENPSGFSDHFDQISAALSFLSGDQKTFIDPLSKNTLDSLHNVVLSVLTNPTADPPLLPADVVPIVNFLASPLGGHLIGDLGPMISPLVALGNGIQDIMAELTGSDADPSQAFQDLIALPGNVVNAFFTGATLNLDALLPAIASAGLLPDGIDINSLSFAFGGLFSPGDVSEGLVVGDGDDAVHVGGSIFNSLGIDLDLDGTKLPIDGVGNGPIAGFAGLLNIIAQGIAGDLPPLEPPADAAATAATAGADLLSGFDPSDWLASP